MTGKLRSRFSNGALKREMVLIYRRRCRRCVGLVGCTGYLSVAESTPNWIAEAGPASLYGARVSVGAASAAL